MKFGIFTNNALKIIACISMLIDHIGLILYPEIEMFRIIGRIAFPIFAFLLAEGCFYTKNKIRHLVVISGFAVVMQLVLYMATKMTDFNIFIHFSVAISLCYLVDFIDYKFRNKNKLSAVLLIMLLLLLCTGIYIFSEYTMYLFSNYSYIGIFLPLTLYIIRKYCKRFYILIDIIPIILSAFILEILVPVIPNAYMILSWLFIILYNGKKGKWNLKYLFYIFYPLHMVLIYAVAIFF